MSKTINYSIAIVGLAAGMAIIGCKKNSNPTIPVLTTNSISNLSFNTATGGGTITSNGGAAITTSGICWSNTNNSPSTGDSLTKGGTTNGSFNGVMNNLQSNTTYYVRAYATNSAGTGYGSVVTFSTTVDTTKVTFTYNGQSVTYGVIVSPTTGRKWMDRNLGATRAAGYASDTLAYGDLFQWGRLADGHQMRTSDTTSVLSTTNTPVDSKFILTVNDNPWYDWITPSNDNLWQGSHGINNPCPSGWHIPFEAEWAAESGVVDSASGYTQLKLTAKSGYRWLDGTFHGKSSGFYWSATPLSGSGNADFFFLNATGSDATSAIQRGNAYSIRCIKD
jgi:hypothetical protein